MQVKIQIQKEKKEPRRIHLLLFIILSLTLFFILSFLLKEKTLVGEEMKVPQPKVPEAPPPPPPKENKENIRRGMTLSDILGGYNISPAEIHKLREEVKPVYDLAKIKAGQEIRIYSSPEGELTSLEYDMDGENYLHIQKINGVYTAEIKKIPYEYRIKMIWGIIEDNPISAVRKENEGVQLALNLADIFDWDIDFTYDLRRGDSFKIIFEKKFLHGKFHSNGTILAAEFTNQGKIFQAFRYTYHDTTESDYFDLEGESLRKQFLKSPIKFRRISSRFSSRRLHPIRKVFRPHYGVDYAANIGTPVRAAASGTVIFAGWNRASGRMIRIRHNNNYETFYLHLRGYKVKKGTKVKSGDTIGWVGSSGESTGPHLDYRIKHRGEYINPLTFNPKPVKPIRAEFLEDFKREAEKYCLWFDAPQVIMSLFSNNPMTNPR